MAKTNQSAAVLDLDALILSAVNTYWGFTLQMIDLSRVQKSLPRLDYGAVSSSVTPRECDKFTHVNDTDVQNTETWNNSKQTVATFKWTISRAVKESSSGSFKITIPKIGDLTLGGSTDVTFSDTSEKSVSMTQTWGWQTIIPIPARSKVEASMLVSEITARAPYDGDLLLTGSVAGVIQNVGLLGNVVLKYIPIGELFAKSPNAAVAVVSPDSIKCVVAGVFEGIQGVDYYIDVKQSPVPRGSFVRIIQIEEK